MRLIELIKKLAYREGLGDILADGMIEAAKKIGHNSEKYLIQIKGQPSIEPFRVRCMSWGTDAGTPLLPGHMCYRQLPGSRSFRIRCIFFRKKRAPAPDTERQYSGYVPKHGDTRSTGSLP